MAVASCDEPNQYRRHGRLEIQIPSEHVAEVLQSADEGREIPSGLEEVQFIRMMRDFSSLGSPRAGVGPQALADGQERDIVLV